jgi:regulator of sigma E protease
VNTWEQFFIAISTRPNRETPIVLLRNGKEFTVTATPTAQTRFEIGDIGVLPDVHPNVQSILANSPAERAGLRPGDVILAVAGTRVTIPRDLIDAISKQPNTTVALTITRNGVQQDLNLTPEANGSTGSVRCPSLPVGAGCIGIAIGEEVITIKPGPIQAIGMSLRRNAEYSRLIFQTVWQLLTRETSTRQLMGPLAIAQLSGESAQAGMTALFSLMAAISLNLGLLNLLPIPVLDGGHIFIMLLEGLARRDFSTKVKEKMFLAGFVVLMMLMVTVIYNDLTRIPLFEKLMPWR